MAITVSTPEEYYEPSGTSIDVSLANGTTGEVTVVALDSPSGNWILPSGWTRLDNLTGQTAILGKELDGTEGSTITFSQGGSGGNMYALAVHLTNATVTVDEAKYTGITSNAPWIPEVTLKGAGIGLVFQYTSILDRSVQNGGLTNPWFNGTFWNFNYQTSAGGYRILGRQMNSLTGAIFTGTFAIALREKSAAVTNTLQPPMTFSSDVTDETGGDIERWNINAVSSVAVGADGFDLSEPIAEDYNNSTTVDYGLGPQSGNAGPGYFWVALRLLPADFQSMGSTITWRSNVREVGNLTDDSVTITFSGLWDSLGTTSYVTNSSTIGRKNVSTDILGVVTGTTAVTAAGLAASKADWEAGYARFWVQCNRSMGSDGATLAIDNFEIYSIYTPTTPQPPLAITDLAIAQQTDGDLRLTWSAPDDSGYAITDYEYSQDGGAWTSFGSTALTQDISGLTYGVSYDFEVRAVNANGSAPTSNLVSEICVAIPDPVDDLFVEYVATAQARFDYGDPNWNGEVGGDQYRIDGGTWTSAPGPPTTLFGHTEGVTYTYEVRVGNSLGYSGPSNLVNYLHATVPDAPVIQDVSYDSSTAYTFDWSVPASDHGAAVTAYRYRIDGGTPVTLGNVLFTQVTGAVRGTSYDIEVSAQNSQGWSAWSTVHQYHHGLPATAPLPLTRTVVDHDSIQLDWVTPGDDGGFPVTSYEVQVDSDSWIDVGLVLTYTYNGLTPGTSYVFRARAITLLGGGSAATGSATPDAVPQAITDLVATPGDEEVTLTWSAPTNLGTAITDYYYRIDGGGDVVVTPTLATTVTITGLTNDVSYDFEVTAENDLGIGSWSNLESATPVGVSSLLHVGDNLVTAIYLGDTSVSAAYLGDTQIL